MCRLALRSQRFPQANWLLAMPLLHFLSDSVSPFEQPRHCDHKISKWWMLCGLDREIDNYRNQSKSGYERWFNRYIFIVTSPCRLLKNAKILVEPLLQLDSLLGRVIIYAHHSDDLKDWIGLIPPSETIRALQNRLSRFHLPVSYYVASSRLGLMLNLTLAGVFERKLASTDGTRFIRN